MKQLEKKMIEWRRDFHKYPETGFLEMRTATIVAQILDGLGYDLKIGKEVMSSKHVMGKPNDEVTKLHVKWAKDNGAIDKYLDRVSDGYTGVVATLETSRPGPVIAFRVDMDALPIYESNDENHIPKKESFRSITNDMHACGHDAHISIGLGLATLLMKNRDNLRGKIKIIFQPAEEGTRGAKSMVEANVVSDVDYFIAIHIGTGIPYNHFLASNNGFLATSKMDVAFKGQASHAGGKPEEGKNAMLAAANAVINLEGIPRHSEGKTRVNVGELSAGSGRNIIADYAELKIETRGENSNINEYMKEYAESVIKGAALMHGVSYDIKLVGEGINSKGSLEIADILHHTSLKMGLLSKLESNKSSVSEDATFFIDAVQKQGGYATYCVFGTELVAGHHNERFDIDESSLLPAVKTLYETAIQISKNKL